MINPRSHAPGLGGDIQIVVDFENHPGLVGDLELPFTLPKNSVISQGFLDFGVPVGRDPNNPTLSQGAATLALWVVNNAPADVLPATAHTAIQGLNAFTPNGDMNFDPVQINDPMPLMLTVGGAPFDFGILTIFLTYWEPGIDFNGLVS